MMYPKCTKIYFKKSQGSKETLKYLHLNKSCLKNYCKEVSVAVSSYFAQKADTLLVERDVTRLQYTS